MTILKSGVPEVPISGKEMVKRYKKAGWYLDHINGSHHIMKKDEGNRTMPIPVHKNESLGKGLEGKLLKEISK
ncbi:MAG: type II toxin-antitoxin system HicA family toxin [Spirochaetaceae bacterium]